MCNSLKFIIRFKRYYFFAFNIKIYDLYITKKILKHGNKEFQDLWKNSYKQVIKVIIENEYFRLKNKFGFIEIKLTKLTI